MTKTVREEWLEARGWEKHEVPYNNFGHTTRTGWTHPSGAFKRPVSEETAMEFQFRYINMKVWEQSRVCKDSK